MSNTLMGKWVEVNPYSGKLGAMTAISREDEVTRLVCQAISLAGSQGKLAKSIGRSQNAIWHAKSTGRITAEMALSIDRATSGAVSRHQLRPDVYGAASEGSLSTAA
jgi:DNA-binding transcriptional regulator YdaS (Cro superfamily)